MVWKQRKKTKKTRKRNTNKSEIQSLDNLFFKSQSRLEKKQLPTLKKKIISFVYIRFYSSVNFLKMIYTFYFLFYYKYSIFLFNKKPKRFSFF